MGVAWTLVIEFSFYLVLPLLAGLLRNLPRPQASLQSQIRTHIWAIAGLISVTWIIRILHSSLFPGKPTPNTWFASGLMQSWLPGYLDWFLIGMLLATWSAWLAAGGRIPSFLALLGRRPWLSWLFAAECLWVVTRLRLSWFEFGSASPRQDQLHGLFTVLSAAFFIAPMIFGDQRAGRIRAALSFRAVSGLGLVSYGIYLWHNEFWALLSKRNASGDFVFDPWLQTFAILVVTIVAALLTYRLLERPLAKFAHRVTAPRGAQPPAGRPQRAHTSSIAPVSPPPVRNESPKTIAAVIGLAVAIGAFGLLIHSHVRTVPTHKTKTTVVSSAPALLRSTDTAPRM